MALDWQKVSSRINGLLNLAGAEDIRRAAERLGVRAYHIEETINRQSRLSALKVAAAIVRVYGVDPSWLLTGTYSAATHRVGMQKDPQAIDLLLKKLVCGTDQSPEYSPPANTPSVRA